MPVKSSKKGLYLSVPTPCEENWNDMPLSAGGRCCGSCQKTVVDFSLLSDAEIFAVISNSKGAVCGHFESWQLDRAIMPGVPARHYFVPAVLLSAGLTLGIVTTGHAESRALEGVEVGIMPANKAISLPNAEIRQLPEMRSLLAPAPRRAMADTVITRKAQQLPEVVVTGYATGKTTTGAVCVSYSVEGGDKPLVAKPLDYRQTPTEKGKNVSCFSNKNTFQAARSQEGVTHAVTH